MRTRKIRFDLDCALEESLRLGLTALLGADNAEQIQGSEFFWVALQHSLQFFLSPIEIAGGDGLRSILNEREIAALGPSFILSAYGWRQ
jgi:hypothetical protein